MTTDKSDFQETLNMLCDIATYSGILSDSITDDDLVGCDDIEFNMIDANVKAALAHIEIACAHSYRASQAKTTGVQQ